MVDLPRVRAALAALDRLVEAHPGLRCEPSANNRAAWLVELEQLKGESVATNDKQTAIRLPSELLERVDRLAAQWQAERPGQRVARSDVLRVLLLQALDTAEGGNDGGK